jgi:hypothetical protein
LKDIEIYLRLMTSIPLKGTTMPAKIPVTIVITKDNKGATLTIKNDTSKCCVGVRDGEYTDVHNEKGEVCFRIGLDGAWVQPGPTIQGVPNWTVVVNKDLGKEGDGFIGMEWAFFLDEGKAHNFYTNMLRMGYVPTLRRFNESDRKYMGASHW